ncbi:MAG: BON domain-containing protein [Acidobacteria bacterium]|nr:BON domain-containing protein [Acidobacteriota bacterium]
MGSALSLVTAVLMAASSAAWAEPVASHDSQSRSAVQQAGLSPAVQARRERQVLHELRMLPYYSVFDNLEFRVNGDRVVLSGQVVRVTLRSDAASRVRKLEWVETVDNRIEVLPVSFHDDRLRRALYRAVYGQAALQRYALQNPGPIHIIVKNGHVTLEGVVANRMESNIAYIQARGVSGVFSVTTRLRVER